MDNGPKEIELKLRATPEDIAALRKHPHFASTLHDPTREKLISVYFDTDNHFLRDHGVTLRVRHIDGKRVQTVKTANCGSGFFERLEWEQAIEGDRPDLSRLKDTALGPIYTDDDVRNSLNPVFETRIERTSHHLNKNGADIIMAFDEGQIVSTDSSCPVSEIELELKHGNPAELFKIARDIINIVPAQIDVKSKPERGYELLEKASVGAEMACDPELNARISTGRAFTLIGRACLRHLVANVPAMISRDADALHQIRVALRRLRAAISLFSKVVSDNRVNMIKTELRWLARECGPARDFDTLLIEVLRPLRKQHSNEPGLVSISKMFERKRLKGYQQALAAVQSAQFRILVLDTAEWIEAGPWSMSEDALMGLRRDMPIKLYTAEQLSQRSRKIRRRGAKISDLNPEQLHRLRIQIKKTRYAVEFFSSLYQSKKSAKRCKEIRSSLAQLQNYLGGVNDIVTRKALFADIIATPARGLTVEQNRRRAFAAGLIIGDQQARFQKLLDRARKAHSRFDSAKPFWKATRQLRAAPPLAPSSESAIVSNVVTHD